MVTQHTSRRSEWVVRWQGHHHTTISTVPLQNIPTALTTLEHPPLENAGWDDLPPRAPAGGPSLPSEPALGSHVPVPPVTPRSGCRLPSPQTHSATDGVGERAAVSTAAGLSPRRAPAPLWSPQLWVSIRRMFCCDTKPHGLGGPEAPTHTLRPRRLHSILPLPYGRPSACP